MKSDLEQGSEQWLAMRRNFIMASDSAAIMGVSPYKTKYQLWQEKLGLWQQPQNEAMRKGKEMEPEMLAYFNSLITFTTQVCVPSVVFNDKISFIGASLDGLSIDGEIAVEMKYANAEDHEYAKNKIVPDKYYTQLQFQMWVTGLKSMYYLSYHKGDYQIFEVCSNLDYQAELCDKTFAFWNDHVLALVPPELEARDFRQRDGRWSTVAERLAHVKNQKALLDKEDKALSQELKELSEGENSTDGTFKYIKSSHDEQEITYTRKAYDSWRLSV